MKMRSGIRNLTSFSTLKLHYSINLENNKEIKTLDTFFRNSMALLELSGFMLFFIYFFNFCPEIRISLFCMVLIVLTLSKLQFHFFIY